MYLVLLAGGRTTIGKHSRPNPVCVVPDMFALNGSTQQASGGVQHFVKLLAPVRSRVRPRRLHLGFG